MAIYAVIDETASNPDDQPPNAAESSMSTAPDVGSERSPMAARRHLGIIFGVAAAVVLLDQLTKWWALDALRTHPINVFWTLRLELTYNTGASFSLGRGSGPLIGLLALAVVGFLVWHGRGISSRLVATGLGLVLGGAIGNLLDRAFRGDAGFMQGAVVDFIDFQWWPIFNVADMGVVIGGIVVVLVYVFRPDAVSGGAD
jgi:signal peptidase II